MFRRLGIAWVTVGRTFGAWVTPVGTFVLLMSLRAVVSAGMALDTLFRPGLRRSRLERPIVIVGNPRSGTTFLHRFLVDQGVGSGLRLWEAMFASITVRTAIRPLLPLLERISPARHHSTVAHDTSLTSVETDDAAILFRFFDGFFLYGFIFAFAERDYRPMFESTVRDTSDRDFAWLERLWRDNAYRHPSRRVVAKLFSLGMRLPRFLERFPEARILYMVRDPTEVIPSGLSLVTGVLDKRFGFWRLPEATRARFIERLYDALVALLRTFHDDWVAGRIPRERVMIVRYDRLMQDFEGLMGEILAFTGTPTTPALEQEIARVAKQQRAFRSQHRYDAQAFGIEPERIRRDCAFVYETFLRGEGTPAATGT
jgi:hypothetical protein